MHIKRTTQEIGDITRYVIYTILVCIITRSKIDRDEQAGGLSIGLIMLNFFFFWPLDSVRIDTWNKCRRLDPETATSYGRVFL